MQFIFLDYETYYTDDYSLRKMTPVEYILDPRFECHGCAIKIGLEGVPFWKEGPELQEFFNGLDPSNTILISHNALFDACITAWVYRFIPRLSSDTLSIARATLSHKLSSLSLASVAMHLGLGGKQHAILKVKGYSLAALKANPILYQEYINYAINDVNLCAGIWHHLVNLHSFPPKELLILDMVIRACIRPKFRLDFNILAEHLHQVQTEKNNLLARAMLVGVNGKADLMSNEKFANLLIEVGCDPPRKISATTGKETWAFSKSDPEFMELEEHPDAAVQALVAARLGWKSTLEETRTQRLLAISHLEWPVSSGVTTKGNMPIPLRYSGAHTHRLSGDWKLNFQNLRRGGQLRRALIPASEDDEVITIDSAQVEARGVAWITKQQNLIKQFSSGEDVYASFATDVFNQTITKEANPNERFVGKQAVLGLGYGLGATKFQLRIKIDSRIQIGRVIELSEDESKRAVYTYRTKYPNVPQAWKMLNTTGVDVLAHGGSWEFGPCLFKQDAIELPSGLHLHYHKLHFHQPTSQWAFEYARKPQRIYGGKLMENIVQALARILIMDTALRVQKRLEKHNIWLNLQVHDELVYVVPKRYSYVVKELLMEEMVFTPDWAKGWPLAAEVGSGSSYGDAK
jgi:DNA polymerase III epsilon subunit-like protein